VFVAKRKIVEVADAFDAMPLELQRDFTRQSFKHSIWFDPRDLLAEWLIGKDQRTVEYNAYHKAERRLMDARRQYLAGLPVCPSGVSMNEFHLAHGMQKYSDRVAPEARQITYYRELGLQRPA
jgi:hypothetical protein